MQRIVVRPVSRLPPRATGRTFTPLETTGVSVDGEVRQAARDTRAQDSPGLRGDSRAANSRARRAGRGAGQRTVSGAAAQPRRLAILAVLARAGKRGASRERLLALLWPDSSEEAGRNTLNHALYTLRRDLGSAEAISGVRELAARAAGDRQRRESVRGDVRRRQSRGGDRRLHRAVPRWVPVAGNPEFDRWVETERDDLARRHAEVLERLARATAQRGTRWVLRPGGGSSPRSTRSTAA
jgi:hypothetical protein